MSELKDILDRNRDRLMAIDGVVGVAIGRSSRDPEKLCVLVYSTAKVRPAALPETLEGYDIEVQRSSGFRAG